MSDELEHHPDYDPELDDPTAEATDEVDDDGDYYAEVVDDGEETE